MATSPCLREVVIPGMRLQSEANSRDHYMAKARRVKDQRFGVTVVLQSCLGMRPPMPPLVVTITRIAPRALDTDNLVASAKAVRDAVAKWLRVDDADPSVEYCYTQEKGRPTEYAVRIQFDIAKGKKTDTLVFTTLNERTGRAAAVSSNGEFFATT